MGYNSSLKQVPQKNLEEFLFLCLWLLLVYYSAVSQLARSD